MKGHLQISCGPILKILNPGKEIQEGKLGCCDDQLSREEAVEEVMGELKKQRKEKEKKWAEWRNTKGFSSSILLNLQSK